jgi:hypothetical protein
MSKHSVTYDTKTQEVLGKLEQNYHKIYSNYGWSIIHKRRVTCLEYAETKLRDMELYNGDEKTRFNQLNIVNYNDTLRILREKIVFHKVQL